LIEEARTNLILQSELTSTSYTNSQSTDSDNDTTAPDGTTTAGTIIDNGVASSHGIYQNPTFVSGTSYTLSAFFKPKELTHAVLRFATTAFPAEMFVEFDLVNLTSVDVSASGAVDTITMEQYPDGWVRCSITDTADASTASVVSFNTSDGNGTSASYTGSTEGVYVWGCQLEAGAFASSYIPTTTAAVTRANDHISVTVSDMDYEGYATTVYADFDIQPVLPYAHVGYLYAFRKAVVHVSTAYAQVNGMYYYHRNPASQLDFALDSTIDDGAGSRMKIATAFAEDDFEGVLNGTSVRTDVGTNTPLAGSSLPTILTIGNDNNINYINTHLKHLAVFNARLSSADMITITTI
jgi:hypothetical protein